MSLSLFETRPHLAQASLKLAGQLIDDLGLWILYVPNAGSRFAHLVLPVVSFLFIACRGLCFIVLCQTFIKMGLLSSFTCSDEFSSLRLHHNRAITHLMRSAKERVRQVSPPTAYFVYGEYI